MATNTNVAVHQGEALGCYGMAVTSDPSSLGASLLVAVNHGVRHAACRSRTMRIDAITAGGADA